MSGRFTALGFDPVPGDPGAVVRSASGLRQVADELGRQAAVLHRSAALTSAWQGSAACLYTGQVAARAVELRTAAEVLGTASQALLRYSGDLRDLQELALRLERAAVPASTAVCLPGPATELDALRAQARRLQERAEHAARYVAQEVRRAAEASPAARRFDGWTDAPLGIPVGRWVAEHEDGLGGVATVAGYAGVALGGAAVVAAGVALLPVATVSAPVVGGLALAGGAVGGVSLLTHAATAHYGDGAWHDVGLDVVGLGAAGVAVPALTRGVPALARAGDRVGHALTAWGAQDLARGKVRGAPTSRPTAAPPTRVPALGRPPTPETRRIDATRRAAARRTVERVLLSPVT